MRDLHLAIASRAFDAVGPAGHGVQRLHDGISRFTYGTIAGVNRWAPRIGATVGAALVPTDAPPLDASKLGNAALGAVNGMWGDHLAGGGNELAIGMSIRQARAEVPVDRPSIAAAFPLATSRIAVLVHGLCETEDTWHPSERRQRKHGSFEFGARLAEHGITPVYVRYNTGLHISDNGARLSALIEELTRAWPVALDEIVLIGHSMGGLVARSACHQGAQEGAEWVARTRHVFGLGAPHLGAPLERGVNVLSWTLHRLPETRGIARVLNARSVGVKDLRHGSLLESDWHGVHVDEFLSGRAGEVPFLPHISYYFVAVTVTRSPHHPLGRAVGDLLVQFASASGRGRRRQLPFDVDKGHHVGGLTHFDLLSHPDVYAQLERWLVRQ